MPENSSKTQSKEADQKTKSRLPNKSLTKAEVEKKTESPAPKSEKSTPKKKETPKSDSQTAKSTKPSESSKTSKASKPKSNSNESGIKVITKKSEKSEKKETKKVSKSTGESIAIKTKPSTKSSKLQKNSKTSPTSTTVKVIKAPKTPKALPAKTPTRNSASLTKPQKPSSKTLNEITRPAKSQKPNRTSKSNTPEIHKSRTQGLKKTERLGAKANKTTKNLNPKSFSFLSIFSKVIAIILGFSSLFFIGMLVHLDVLPTKYLFPAILLIIVISGGFGLLLAHQKTKPVIKMPINILSVALSCIYLVGGGYIAEASGFLDSLKPQEYVSEQYYVIVNNSSDFQDIKDLENKTVGTFDENIEIYQEAIKELNNAVSADLKDYQSAHAMADNLLSDNLDAIFISAIHKSVIDEDSSEFSQNTRILYTIEVKVKADTTIEHPNIDVTSEPFTIYISGNDSYGDLAARGLSDVNMLVTVNPVTHEVLLTSIPRDCYVQLHGTTGTKDKLTHAGMYGVQMSIQTIEDLLDINIDYYVKINFPALISLVDAIGGIDVYSDKTFKPLHGDEIVKEGMNHFDGAMALAFARERMAYSYGDRHRVQNQRDVLNAIIQKVSSSPVILTKTNEILNSLSSNLDTNISKSEISSLVKLQLDSMPSWKIAEYMINGSDLYTYTYTFDDQPRYVMPPYPESIETAHDYITGIMEGKTIEELKIPKPEKSWK